MTQKNTELMTLAAFEQLLDTHGALEAWPEQQRLMGRSLVEQSSEARAMLQELHLLEGSLAELPELAPSTRLCRAVAEIPLRNPRSSASGFDLSFLWRPLVTVGLCAVMGVSLGLTTTETEPEAMTEYDEEWEDGLALTQLAFASEWVGEEYDE